MFETDNFKEYVYANFIFDGTARRIISNLVDYAEDKLYTKEMDSQEVAEFLYNTIDNGLELYEIEQFLH
ncbi:hypothetical protein [Filifactor alocis]|uniref:hypothetical protein n=1 Tax=Filifactor alocis TaxID=143361 RepID=UPI003F9EC9FB